MLMKLYLMILSGASPMDQILLVGSTVLVVFAFAYTAIYYFRAWLPGARKDLIHGVNHFCDQLEAINAAMSAVDDEPYDPSWMDFEKWEKSKIKRR